MQRKVKHLLQCLYENSTYVMEGNTGINKQGPNGIETSFDYSILYMRNSNKEGFLCLCSSFGTIYKGQLDCVTVI